MRFCPFCAQENPDDARECGHCGKRLPAPRTAPPRPPPAPAAEKPKVPSRPAPRSKPLEGPPLRPAAQPAEAQPRDPPSANVPAPSALPPIPKHAPPANSEAVTIAQDSAPPAPKSKAPTGTMLGLPASDSVTGPSRLPPVRPATRLGLGEPNPPPVVPVAGDADSGRRETRPLDVNNAAKAFKQTQPRGVSPIANTVAAPTHKRLPNLPVNEDTQTDPSPRMEPRAMVDSQPNVIDSRPVTIERGASDDVDTNDEVPLPRMELSPTPVLPTLALPPMPPPPRGGKIVDSVLYLLPLAKAIWARQKAQKTIRALLHGDQRLLDSVLRDLGRAAREAHLQVPAVADEMRRVKAEEERRGRAEAQMVEIDANAQRERDRWVADEAERNTDLASREVQVRGAEEELKKKGDERRVHETERARIDGLIRAAEKRASQGDARAQKAEITPPEKGGGPNTAANARAEADAARKEATALIPSRDVARAHVDALDGPIANLTKQVVDGRAAIGLKRKELAEALAAHKRTLAAFEADKRRAETERDGAEREMSQRFVAAGTLLNLNRVDDERFRPMYGRVDELKGGVNAREAAIVRLESERRTYDRAAVQKGLLAIGVAFGSLILLAIILVVVFARR